MTYGLAGKNKRLTLIVGMLTMLCTGTISEKSFAQDIHFSQYLSSPFNLNPSLAGDFKGDYRLVANYRNQWRTVTTPFKTYGFSADASKVAGIQNLAGGLSVYNDAAGDSEMNTLILQIPVSYGYALTSDSAHSIYFGVMPGLVRQQIDYSKLTFDNQYNEQTGVYDPSLSSRETQLAENINYFNLSSGIRWNFTLAPRHRIDVGVSAFNLIGNGKGYSVDENSNAIRYNLHANYEVPLASKFELLPGIMYSRQKDNRNVVMGTSSRYHFNGMTAVHLGAWYRNSDATFVTLGLTYQTLYFGFSYDMNTSALSESSGRQGAFELSVIYVIRKFKPTKGRYISCPNYL